MRAKSAGACHASVTSPAWSPAVAGVPGQQEGEHTAPLALPRCSRRPGNLAKLRVLVPPQNPHKSGPRRWFPTESPRTRRHSLAHDGTDANMPLPPLTGLYAGSTGLTILDLPVVPAATDLLLSGRSRVRVAVGAQVKQHPPQPDGGFVPSVCPLTQPQFPSSTRPAQPARPCPPRRPGPAGAHGTSAGRPARRARCRAPSGPEFLRIRARVGGELISGVPQVVQVEAIQADSGQSRQPHAAAEVRMSQR